MWKLLLFQKIWYWEIYYLPRRKYNSYLKIKNEENLQSNDKVMTIYMFAICKCKESKMLRTSQLQVDTLCWSIFRTVIRWKTTKVSKLKLIGFEGKGCYLHTRTDLHKTVNWINSRVSPLSTICASTEDL